jgi:hypothetical protein
MKYRLGVIVIPLTSGWARKKVGYLGLCQGPVDCSEIVGLVLAQSESSAPLAICGDPFRNNVGAEDIC